MEKVDQYILEQKSRGVPHALEARIRARISAYEAEEQEVGSPFLPWQKAVIAMSFVLVLFSGFWIGGMGQKSRTNDRGLVINDTYMEQLSIYRSDESE